MKKLSILFIAILSIALVSSCTAQGGLPKANLKTELDTISYAVGLSALNAQNLLSALEQREGIDSTLLPDFFRGFMEGATSKMDQKKNAYLIGLSIGKQIGVTVLDNVNKDFFPFDSTMSLNKNNYLAGYIAGVTKKDVRMDVMAAQTYFEVKLQEIQERKMAEKFGDNRENGVKFLEENKKNEGVVVLNSGLQYKIIRQGKGALPTENSKVKVHYHGTLIDGTVFDSSVDRGTPAEFGVTQVIRGWTEALMLMPVGSKWMLYIPQELAYGGQERPSIKPFSALIFEVELLDIVK